MKLWIERQLRHPGSGKVTKCPLFFLGSSGAASAVVLELRASVAFMLQIKQVSAVCVWGALGLQEIHLLH